MAVAIGPTELVEAVVAVGRGGDGTARDGVRIGGAAVCLNDFAEAFLMLVAVTFTSVR